MSIEQFKDENLKLRNFLSIKIDLFNEAVRSGFGFRPIARENNPKEYFAACVFYKIHSLGISVENCIFSNDVFLSLYLFRYIYELYIKVFYVFSGSSEQEILLRLNEFFKDQKWNFNEIKNKINDKFLHPEFKTSHQSRYQLLSKFVHPNYDSLKLCLNKTNDQQFEFLEPNIHLTIWYSVEIIKYFSSVEMLNFHIKIDQQKLGEIQNMAIQRSTEPSQ